MVPIMGVPFLARTMERLSTAGITDVILPSGYMPKAISDYFGDGSQLGMKITYVIEETPLGTAGALKNVQEHITGPFFVLNGDILTSLDLRAMMEHHKKKGGAGALHLIRVEDPSAFGCVVHDANGQISSFVEKPALGTAPTNEINAGTYLMEPSVLDMIPAGRPVSIERETFPEIIAAGKGLFAYTTDDYWIDLGKPEQYLAAHRDIMDGSMPLALEPGLSGAGASALRSIQGAVAPVHADAGVVIHPSATVGPNVVLGEGCRIGKDAVIRETVLWDGVVVGDGAVIDGSIIASRTTIGAGARIGAGSVIGHDMAIAENAVLSEGSRVGPTAPAR
jgi:mannose-1-phosphate guanylyltransferase